MNAQHSIDMPTRWEMSAIGSMSACTGTRGAIRPHTQTVGDDLPREPLDVRGDMSASTRQSDVGCLYAKLVDGVGQAAEQFRRLDVHIVREPRLNPIVSQTLRRSYSALRTRRH